MASDEKTVLSVITPNDKFLRDVFSNAKAYFVDIYQREYKWTQDNVKTLLHDIESRFSVGPHDQTVAEEIRAAVLEHFEPYFLNTFLTHSTATQIYIVDGQQRLTTFLLILIRLYQILQDFERQKEDHEDDPYFEQKTFSSNTLKDLIYESDDFGVPTRFKIFNENRQQTFRQIVDDEPITPKDETQQRIRDNFQIISNYFEGFLMEDYSEQYDIAKITYYITYILDRISIVEIKIEKQQNVATIFEVVNDRGLGLKPYEILKGKLIGNLPSSKKEDANRIWTRLQDEYFNAEVKYSTESKLDLDYFFRTFFRAKFAESENDYDRFEGPYHYEIYRNKKIRNYFKDFTDTELLYNRIVEDIKYFADLYLHLRTSYEYEYLMYNKFLDQNQQYLLILSCIDVEDDDRVRKEKITGIARKFDQLHAIMRLLNVYDSNDFQTIIYPINRDIRNRSLEDAEAVFDNVLITHLEEKEVLRKGEIKEVSDIFIYERFKGPQNRWKNFSKYVLMRIDRYLSQLLDKPSYAGSNLNELEERFNKSNQRRYGLHLEHIYAYNDQNIKLFTDNNVFDEQQFMSVRDRLGMVLLLKDRQNISSGNEIYTDKIETYKKSNFIWNELLVGHLPGVDVRLLPEELQSEPVAPDSTGAFPKNKVDERQRLLFNVIKRIWCDSISLPN